ncbi:hypothetical protein DPMN_011680 [Dreissena polymorpha]|uniref:Uncharacterized protein n=1 Tax=Dreissena polymorpha TaxID=45954 RepID=A0A9D4N106_DREPO|nr:hypothetical protein DPMN_011680 [Dreissena polymorpha]
MIGSDIRALNVYLKQGANLGSPIFTRAGTQGPNWLLGQIPITGNGAAQVRICFTLRSRITRECAHTYLK